MMRTTSNSTYQQGSIRWRKLADGTPIADLRWKERDVAGKWKDRTKSLRGVTAKDAQRELDQIVGEINAGGGVALGGPASPKVIFKDLVETKWAAYVEKQKMRPGTVAGYKAPLEKWIVPFFGQMVVAEISASDVTDFMTKLAKQGLSGKYQKNIYDLLRCLFDLAFTYDIIKTSPVKPKLHRPEVAKREKLVLPFEKWRPFFMALPEIWRAPLLILLTTGMRQGEILGLRWLNIDFQGRKIRKTHMWDVKSHQLLPGLKNGDLTHEVGLSDFMAYVLQEHRAASRFNQPTDFVFCNERGEIWHPDTMRDVIHRALTAIGIEIVPRAMGAHMFRHTAGTYLQAKSGDLKLVQDQLGHADIKTTANFYIHPDDARRLEAANILSAPLAELFVVSLRQEVAN